MTMWPWRKRCPRPSQEAREAVRQADRAFADAERLDDAAKDVAQRLAARGTRNHFREAVEEAMRRPRT